MRCTGCKVTYFCDRNCQTLGWKDHKKACKELAKANEAPPAPAPEALAAGGAPQKAAPGTSKIQSTMQEGTAFIQENKFQEALAKASPAAHQLWIASRIDTSPSPAWTCAYSPVCIPQCIGQPAWNTADVGCAAVGSGATTAACARPQSSSLPSSIPKNSTRVEAPPS